MYNQNIFDIELCFQWPLQLKTSDQSFLFTLVFGHGKRVFQPLSTICTMVSNPSAMFSHETSVNFLTWSKWALFLINFIYVFLIIPNTEFESRCNSKKKSQLWNSCFEMFQKIKQNLWKTGQGQSHIFRF